MRVIYLGTPRFAVLPLEALARDPRFEVVGVVTQPDRPTGRKGAAQPPPVKQAAHALGLPVLQPATLRDESALEQLVAWRPDVGVVAAYGEILRKRALEIPPFGYVNIHPSLLPLYRGPAPVAGAILGGDSETGVSLIRLEAKMDAGPILAQQRVPLPPDARTEPLTYELFGLGAAMLCDTLPAYAAGTLNLVQQDEQAATFTKLLSRDDSVITWSLPAAQIERMIRAYDQWPGASSTWRGAPVKILAARVVAWDGDARPGTLLDQATATVATGNGALALAEVQPAGKRPMAATDWLRGQRPHDGEQFGGA